MAVYAVVVVLVLSQPHADVSARDVLRGIADREAGIMNFSFHVDMDIWSEGEDLRGTPGLRFEGTLVAGTGGRYRLEGSDRRQGRGPGEPSVLERLIQVYDGQTQRYAVGQGELTHGSITGMPSPYALHVEPALFTTEFQQVPVSKFLRHRAEKYNHETVIAGRKDFDGRSVLVVETFPIEAGGKFWKQQLYVDDERAFSVVRKAGMLKDATADEWGANYVCELTDNIEAAPGIWVPRHATSTLYQKHAGKPSHVFSHTVARIDDWVVNSQLSESTFDFDFPPNVFVEDELTGKKYTTGLVNDPLVAARSAEAMRLASKRNTWVAVLLGIGLFLILLLGVRAARARSTARG
ncbi:MAG TPA: hypothetical protein VMU78_04215 [Methylocella sp.]|nr:hypothetical protein [Methylocella sp.]